MAATTLEGVTRGGHSGVGIGATCSRSTDPGVAWSRMSRWAGGAPLCAFSRRSGHGTTRCATCRPPSHRRLQAWGSGAMFIGRTLAGPQVRGAL
eukprot:6881693-Prymnesium_polylepis.1